MVDSSTSRVTATFECNYISTFEFAAVIQEVVSKMCPSAVVNIERNGVMLIKRVAVCRVICIFQWC